MKNCIDMPIFHRAICAENVTNKPLFDKRNCIRRFLLRFLEKNVLGMEDRLKRKCEFWRTDSG